jgi:hypothetical protein
MSSAAFALSALGIVLVLANWYRRPEAAAAWMAALAMFVVMVATLRFSRRAVRSGATTTAVSGLDRIPVAVVFAALMMGIPLALTLARSYGFVDGSDVARRSTGILTGVFLAMLGNVMPKNLPRLSSGCDGARQQAFQRLAGWTWVLCGLASAIGWLALPIDLAEKTTMVLMVTALGATLVHFLRLARRPNTHQPWD